MHAAMRPHLPGCPVRAPISQRPPARPVAPPPRRPSLAARATEAPPAPASAISVAFEDADGCTVLTLTAPGADGMLAEVR